MSPARRALRRLRERRPRYTREQLDAPNWPHPRPARDPRLQWLAAGLSWSALVQAILGPAPSAIQTSARFGWFATAIFGVLTAVSSALLLYAARCKSRYWSFATELCSCIGMSAVFGIYTVATIASVDDWYDTTVAGIAVALTAGNVSRGVILAGQFF